MQIHHMIPDLHLLTTPCLPTILGPSSQMRPRSLSFSIFAMNTLTPTGLNVNPLDYSTQAEGYRQSCRRTFLYNTFAINATWVPSHFPPDHPIPTWPAPFYGNFIFYNSSPPLPSPSYSYLMSTYPLVSKTLNPVSPRSSRARKNTRVPPWYHIEHWHINAESGDHVEFRRKKIGNRPRATLVTRNSKKMPIPW